MLTEDCDRAAFARVAQLAEQLLPGIDGRRLVGDWRPLFQTSPWCPEGKASSGAQPSRVKTACSSPALGPTSSARALPVPRRASLPPLLHGSALHHCIAALCTLRCCTALHCCTLRTGLLHCATILQRERPPHVNERLGRPPRRLPRPGPLGRPLPQQACSRRPIRFFCLQSLAEESIRAATSQPTPTPPCLPCTAHRAPAASLLHAWPPLM